MGKGKKIEDFSESYNSNQIDELLLQVTPEQQENTDYKMKMAAKIYAALQRKGWTQTQLAEVMDKQVSVISKWLSGTHNFTMDTLITIQRILDIQLLDVEEYKEKHNWDIKLRISSRVGLNEEELHNTIYEVGGMSATGYSKTVIEEKQW